MPGLGSSGPHTMGLKICARINPLFFQLDFLLAAMSPFVLLQIRITSELLLNFGFTSDFPHGMLRQGRSHCIPMYQSLPSGT